MKLTSRIFVLFFFFTSCSNGLSENVKTEIEKNPFSKEIKNHKSSALILIPDMGCSTCLNTSIYFLKSNLGKFDNLYYLFTNVNARKSLKLKIGLENLDIAKEYIMFDSNILLNSNYFNSSYPTIVWFKNGEIFEFIESNSSRIYEDLNDTKAFIQQGGGVELESK